MDTPGYGQQSVFATGRLPVSALRYVHQGAGSGQVGPYLARHSLASSLDRLPQPAASGGDQLKKSDSAPSFFSAANREKYPEQKEEDASYFGAPTSTGGTKPVAAGLQTTPAATPSPPASKYGAPYSHQQQKAEEKASKRSQEPGSAMPSAPRSGKFPRPFVPMGLSVIDETHPVEVKSQNRQNSNNYQYPESPYSSTNQLIINDHNTYNGRKEKEKKVKPKEKAMVGIAAGTGTMATGMAVTSTGVMATEAAAATPMCAGFCANCVFIKFVSSVMFVGVVAGIGYAGYSGVMGQMSRQTTEAPTTTSFTTEVTSAMDYTTDSPAQLCPPASPLAMYHLIQHIPDDGRCANLTAGFYMSPLSCRGFYYCCPGAQLLGVTTCPKGYIYSPSSVSCEYENENYYRDPQNCRKFHRCWNDGTGIRREQYKCNDLEYFSVKKPGSAVCAPMEDVTDCPLSNTTSAS